MKHTIRKACITVVAIHLGTAVAAHAQIDPMRCEAKSLRCASNYYECLARCDRQMAAQPSTAAAVATARHSRCENGCDERHTQKMATIKSTPPCKEVEVTPNPRECEARFLRIEADYMVCQARCDNRSKPADCRDNCTTHYQTNVDELNSEPVCKNGRVTPAPDSL